MKEERMASPEQIPLAEDGGIARIGRQVLVVRDRRPCVRNEWGGMGPLELLKLRREERKTREDHDASLLMMLFDGDGEKEGVKA